MPVTFLRHATKLEGKNGALSTVGRQQAAALSGHYQYVICSPLRRAQETLTYSHLTWDQFTTDADIRERIFNEGDLLDEETFTVPESDQDFWARVQRFKTTLQRLTVNYQVLVIGHAYIFSAWEKGHALQHAELRLMDE